MLAVLAAASAKPLLIPVDVSVGPTAWSFAGPVQRDQLIHTGLSFKVQAVIDQKTIRRYRKRIPARYRRLAMSLTEVRINPAPWLPETLIISPRVLGTGMFGASWRPFSLGVPLTKGVVETDLSVAPRLTYAYIYSSTLGNTHFLRPGIDVRLMSEFVFSDSFRVSLALESQFYIPQPVGGSILALGGLDDSLWQVTAGTLKLHFRFDKLVNL